MPRKKKPLPALPARFKEVTTVTKPGPVPPDYGDYRTMQYKCHVEAHIRVSTPDGRLIDDSRSRGRPVSFKYGSSQLLPSLEKALYGMPVGHTWTVSIPAKLAYGDTGLPGLIKPDQDLVFEVELLRVGMCQRTQRVPSGLTME